MALLVIRTERSQGFTFHKWSPNHLPIRAISVFTESQTGYVVLQNSITTEGVSLSLASGVPRDIEVDILGKYAER